MLHSSYYPTYLASSGSVRVVNLVYEPSFTGIVSKDHAKLETHQRTSYPRNGPPGRIHIESEYSNDPCETLSHGKQHDCNSAVGSPIRVGRLGAPLPAIYGPIWSTNARTTEQSTCPRHMQRPIIPRDSLEVPLVGPPRPPNRPSTHVHLMPGARGCDLVAIAMHLSARMHDHTSTGSE